jgi:transposase
MPTIFTEPATKVIGGVDTHKHFHVAVVINMIGHVLGTGRFDANPAGYQSLLDWLGSFGTVHKIGVEGTGAYGAGLARHLQADGVIVVEVNRPNRQTRRRKGKSDPTDAEAAARAVLSGEASLIPKDTTAETEAVRALRVVRRSAMRNRTQAANQIHNLILTAPAALRTTLDSKSILRVIPKILGMEPGILDGPEAATIFSLRSLAQRWQSLTTEIKQLTTHSKHSSPA